MPTNEIAAKQDTDMAFDPFTEGFSLVKTILQKAFPDANLEQQAKIDSAAMLIANEHARIIAQLDINKVEAAHPSIWVAGWRPALGWVGAASLAYNFLAMPLLNGVATLFGFQAAFHPTPTEQITSLIAGLTGLAAARSYDKSKNKETVLFSR